MCSQRLSSGLPEDEDDDVWADKTKEISFGDKVDESKEEEKKMDVDSNEDRE